MDLFPNLQRVLGPAFAFYCILAFLLCVGFFLAIQSAFRKKRTPRVGIRTLRQTSQRKSKVSGNASDIYYCPQCFLSSDEPGVCQNEDHLTPVTLVKDSRDNLEYIEEMQKLINPESPHEQS